MIVIRLTCYLGWEFKAEAETSPAGTRGLPLSENNMHIDGNFNARHVLQSFLEHEYAFSFVCKGKEIRISHYKGQWHGVKVSPLGTQAMDAFEWQDGYGGFRSRNELTEAVGKDSQARAIEKYCSTDREYEAQAIIAFLEVWSGPVRDITSFSVMQPGRNALLHPYSGSFELYPNESEFHDFE